jgi:hypothetical protein
LQVGAITARYLEHQDVIEEALAGRASISADATLLPLIFDARLAPEGERAFALRHIHAYYCLDVPCISLGNYEATLDYFPIRFRDVVVLPPLSTLESAEIDLAPALFPEHADHLLVWAMPLEWSHRSELERRYAMTFAQGRLSVYERRDADASPQLERP